MRARAALTCRSGFAGAAQSRTAKLPHTNQPNPLNSLMFALISLCPIKLARLRLFSHKLRKFDATSCESGRIGVEAFASGRWLSLALSHNGLWVFANRILANGIFAHRVLADWRRRPRGRLLARQIGGSGNAQHGDEPSRYEFGRPHVSTPVTLDTRTPPSA